MVQAAPKPVVLITGAARRIGAALARDFAEHGWRIAIHCRRSLAEANDLVDSLAAGGTEAVVLEADLRRNADVAGLVPRCVELLGAPSCLVNNASEFLFDDLQTLSPHTWEAQLAVNLEAPVFLAKAFCSALPDSQHGNVINIIDQRVLDPTPEFFSYTISKAALWTATRMLAQAMAPQVRVNAIGPGPALPSVHQTEAQFNRERADTPLRRGTSPEEIAAAIRFILDAPAMTGQMIVLDGGQHLARSLDERLRVDDR